MQHVWVHLKKATSSGNVAYIQCRNCDIKAKPTQISQESSCSGRKVKEERWLVDTTKKDTKLVKKKVNP